MGTRSDPWSVGAGVMVPIMGRYMVLNMPDVNPPSWVQGRIGGPEAGEMVPIMGTRSY